MLLEVSPQERLAYAWAVADSHHMRLTQVSERLIERYRERTAQLSTTECWDWLSAYPLQMQ
jgi:hypothetical protein